MSDFNPRLKPIFNWRPRFRLIGRCAEPGIRGLVLSLMPGTGPYDREHIDAVVAGVAAKISIMPNYLSLGFLCATWLFDCLALFRFGRRFRKLCELDKARYIEMWQRSSNHFAKTFILFYRRLTSFDYFSRLQTARHDPDFTTSKISENISTPTENLAELECDILVVGSGPSGSLTAYHLAAAGFDVLVVEEGPDASSSPTLPYSSIEMNLKYRGAALTPCLGKNVVTYAEGRCLGGGSEINAGFFHPPLPDVLERWCRENHIEALNQEQLAPFVDEIRKEISIGYVRGGEGAASLKLKIGADIIGWTSREIPRWISSRRDSDGIWENIRHGMTATYIPKAKKCGARFRTGIKITALDVTSNIAVGKRLDGYVPVDSIKIAYRHVFVCAGAIQTPLILRNSGFRKNIGNSLQMHPMSRLIARFADNVNEGEFGVPVRQVVEFLPALTLGCSISQPAHLSLWTSSAERSSTLNDEMKMAAFYALISSPTKGRVRNLPLFNEPLVFYNLTNADFECLAEGLVKLGRVLFEAGALELFLPFEGAPSVHTLDQLREAVRGLASSEPDVSVIHLFGSCPIGGDPSRFPLDSYGKLIGASNIYVNDASMLPGCTGVNPQGTLMAVAQRNVRHFVEKLR